MWSQFSVLFSQKIEQEIEIIYETQLEARKVFVAVFKWLREIIVLGTGHMLAKERKEITLNKKHKTNEKKQRFKNRRSKKIWKLSKKMFNLKRQVSFWQQLAHFVHRVVINWSRILQGIWRLYKVSDLQIFHTIESWSKVHQSWEVGACLTLLSLFMIEMFRVEEIKNLKTGLASWSSSLWFLFSNSTERINRNDKLHNPIRNYLRKVWRA